MADQYITLAKAAEAERMVITAAAAVMVTVRKMDLFMQCTSLVRTGPESQ